MFNTEKELVNHSIPLIKKYFCPSKVLEEPKGLYGIPDVVIYTGLVISFEFKLRNWKKALKQAYRYRSFSSQSYVFIEKSHLNPPLKNIDLFEKVNIGLCTYDKDEIKFLFVPKTTEPYSLRFDNILYNLLDSVS